MRDLPCRLDGTFFPGERNPMREFGDYLVGAPQATAAPEVRTSGVKSELPGIIGGTPIPGSSSSQKPFLDAARISGSGPGRILPYAGIQMMGAGIGALTSVAFIQYLGATDESQVGLGSMIYTAIDIQPVLTGIGSFKMGDFHARIGWTSLLAAGLAMTLIGAVFYLIAVGSRDAIIPESRR
jgi:hypothetical protein